MDETRYYIYNEDGEAVRVAVLSDKDFLPTTSLKESRTYARFLQNENQTMDLPDIEEAPI